MRKLGTPKTTPKPELPQPRTAPRNRYRLSLEKRRDVFKRLSALLESVNTRSRAPLSNAEIAKKLGVARTLPDKWKKGVKDPRFAPLPSGDVLAALAMKFDVSADWILSGWERLSSNRDEQGHTNRIGDALVDYVKSQLESRIYDNPVEDFQGSSSWGRLVATDIAAERLLSATVDLAENALRAAHPVNCQRRRLSAALAKVKELPRVAGAGRSADRLLLVHLEQDIERLEPLLPAGIPLANNPPFDFEVKWGGYSTLVDEAGEHRAPRRVKEKPTP